MRTLNIGCGRDTWGTDKLDHYKYSKDVRLYDFNSGKRLPFKDGIFDEVRLHGVLEFMVDPQFILEECHRVMKKNAVLSIVAINIESLRFFLSPRRGQGYTGRKKDVLKSGSVISPMSIYFVSKRLELAGFRVIRTGTRSDIFPFRDNVKVRAVKV